MNQTKLFKFKTWKYSTFKLFVAGLICFIASIASKEITMTLFVLAGIWLMLPIRPTFSKKLRGFSRLYEGDGDPDDDDDKKAKEVIAAVKRQTIKELEKRGMIDKAALTKELNIRMAAFKDLTKEEIDKWKKLLADDEGSPEAIRAMLKKQGEAITALQEIGKKTDKEVVNLRAALKEKMKDIKKIFEEGNGEVRLNVRAAAIMTTANTIEGDDLLPDDLIESFSIGAFVPKRQAREYVFDLATRRTQADLPKYKIWLEEGDEEGGFAVVAEGGLKPLVSTNLVRNYVGLSKIAAKRVYTEEFVKFRKEAYSIIERLIQQKLIRDYATMLTTALISDAAPYVSSALDGQYAEPTDYHAIGAVAAQIEALEFFPDMLIMNPQDKWRIGLSQDSNGQFYLQIPMVDPNGQTRMMGFTLRTSTKVPVGSFLLGESGLWEIEDEPIQVRIGMGVTVTGGTSNGGGDVTDVQSDFDHNRFRIIAETYFRSYIASSNQGSFVMAEFDVVKAALTTP